ncbi:hypothetical protein ACFQL5_09915 [Aquipuribacter hungaricus]|uniref:hypothetical protein n=1 Tax=Aquipuribacter hungaricus TaxID=545624 RepID=UPI00360D5241
MPDGGPGTPAAALFVAAGLAGVLAGPTLVAPAGTAVMTASALVPPLLLGGALVRARTALAHERRLRRTVAGELVVTDQQVGRLAGRLAGRLDLLADQGMEDAAELERTRRQLRRARVELATSRAVLSGVRADAARDRAAAEEAVLAAARSRRDLARAQAALAEAVVPDVVVLEAVVPQAVPSGATLSGVASEAPLRVPAAPAPVPTDAPVPAGAPRLPVGAGVPTPRSGRRSFASVDLRVFDAFSEADLEDEDAVLEAPVRRGRHAAGPAVERPEAGPVTAPSLLTAATVPVPGRGTSPVTDPAATAARAAVVA